MKFIGLVICIVKGKQINIYIYIYIYMCACVCVCVEYNNGF